MKKVICLILTLVCALGLTGCGEGVVLDENEVVENNGTASIVKGGINYTLSDGKIFADNVEICSVEGLMAEKLFALGGYLYVNTSSGARQITLDGKKNKKFGSGEIIGAFGRWIYYQSEDNKVGNMIVYKIDMKEGRQLNLFQDTISEVKEIEDQVIYFKGVSGNEYINEVNDDNGYFYSEWLTHNADEDETDNM